MVRTEGFTEANGDQPGVPNIIVIFTDGNSNINELQTIPEALLAKKAGIHIIVVGTFIFLVYMALCKLL